VPEIRLGKWGLGNGPSGRSPNLRRGFLKEGLKCPGCGGPVIENGKKCPDCGEPMVECALHGPHCNLNIPDELSLRQVRWLQHGWQYFLKKMEGNGLKKIRKTIPGWKRHG